MVSKGIFDEVIDVELHHTNLFGDHLYQLNMDGQKFDFFMTRKELTWEQQSQVEQSYREALVGYRSPC